MCADCILAWQLQENFEQTDPASASSYHRHGRQVRIKQARVKGGTGCIAVS